MGDANVRRPVATRFEHGVDFGLLVHKSPFMADKRDPLVLSNYIFELLEVNPGVAGFLIQLHPDDVDAVVESVTAHAEKGAGTKTTLYVGQEEEEEEVEEEEEDAGGVGAGGRKEKPHNPLMISVQKVRIRPGKGKGQSDGWFTQPLTHNTRRVCTDDPENKLPMHSLCPTREWEREWYGVTTPNIISGQGQRQHSHNEHPVLHRCVLRTSGHTRETKHQGPQAPAYGVQLWVGNDNSLVKVVSEKQSNMSRTCLFV